jgi:cysteine desulfurase
MLALTPSPATPGGSDSVERLLVSAIEHASVRAGGRFAADAVALIRVSGDGTLDLRHLAEELSEERTRGGRVLVSLMAANNETGAVQPVRAAADIVHAVGGLLHVDAVQAVGRIAIDINEMQADLLTVSAHKIGGPQGAGALIGRDESLPFPEPLIKGGGQEMGSRAGTENVAGIAGFGAAAAAAGQQLETERAHMAALRDRLEAGLLGISPDAVIFSSAVERVPNTTLFAVPGVKAETALIALDLDGVAVSSGAACSSGKVAPSHVLAAMGVDPALAAGAIRVSVGYSSQESDIARFLQAWRKCIAALGKGRREIAA